MNMFVINTKTSTHPSIKRPEMNWLSGGTFRMGDEISSRATERPEHDVTIKAFGIGKYPITFEEFDFFCEATKRDKPEDMGWGRERRPVIMISWYDAQAYCQWLSDKTSWIYRLPTEAEWEYAYKAERNNKFYWGRFADPDYAWYYDNSEDMTHPVGEKKPNIFASSLTLELYDMAGNVWEWVQDSWHDNYEGAPEDGSAWENEQNDTGILRGGSWKSKPEEVRRTIRRGKNKNIKENDIGFRIASTLKMGIG